MKFKIIKTSDFLRENKPEEVELNSLEDLIEWFKDKGEVIMNVHHWGDDDTMRNDPYLMEIYDDYRE